MEIKKLAQKLFSPIALGVASLLISVTTTYAASGSISVVPQSGTYQRGQVFNAAIKIDGGGTAFNAAKASVAVSQNISVQSVTLGDCDFALVKTPSIGSLAFAGVILGGSTNNCTIYTLSLVAQSGGTGFVFVSDGSIKSYKGATELLASTNNSSYTFDAGSNSANSNSNTVASQPAPTQAPLSLANGVKLYTLVYNIQTPDNKPPTNLKVALDKDLPTQMLATPQPSTDNPNVYAATFDNVPQGVHEISVLNNEKSVSKQIVNIGGENREITLGVTPTSTGLGTIWLIAIAVVLVLLITGGALFYMIIWRKNHPVSV